MESNSPVKLSEEVTKAKADGIPIVCLESTVFSQLGLPSPSNAEALELCMSTLKNNDDNLVEVILYKPENGGMF